MHIRGVYRSATFIRLRISLQYYMYVHVHVRTLVQVLLEEANTHSGTVGFAPEKHNEPL